MKAQAELVEGIVLTTKDLLQGKFIATLFTKEKGVIQVLCYGKKHAFFQAPFPYIKASVQKKKSDFFWMQEATFLKAFSASTYDNFQYAAKMAKILLDTQLPLYKTERLYLLFHSYLKKLSSSSYALHLWLSFQLKVLLYEGVFLLEDLCSECKEPALGIDEGRPVCLFHASKSSFCFNTKEWEAMKILAKSKLFSELITATIDNSLEKKIESMCCYLFKEGQW